MKINPLLSNDITVSDQNDENHNEKYSKELKVWPPEKDNFSLS